MNNNKKFSKKNISLNGIRGYIGSSLLHKIKDSNKYNISLLCRSENQINENNPGILIKKGDLLDRNSLRGWLLPNSTVIHLAYMWNESRETNLIATQNLVNECLNAGVKRIIHISTAAVVGRTHETWVNETTKCHPFSEYGKIKLAIENMLIEMTNKTKIDLLILRPTSVYGIDGEPLKKLCNDLKNKNWLINYLKSCLFGNRAMNLVHIENLLEVIEFAINHEENFNKEIFIISEDDEKENNFIDVEEIIKEEWMGNRKKIPKYKMPTIILNSILKLMNRNIVNAQCRFNPEKFKLRYEYTYKKNFLAGVKEYAAWNKQKNNI